MRCLCCNKILDSNSNNGWHFKCIKNFFNTDKLPKLDLTKDRINEIANNNVSKGLTITGVQKKLSLNLSQYGKDKRLTLVNYPSGYILKPNVEEYESLPENEQLVMSLADLVGIKTVPHALIKLENGEYAYITKRIDRIISKNKVKKIAMEDFCQLGNQLTIDKYRGSYEKCAKIIQKYSSRELLDLSELFYRIVFFYITGNSDMHMKNFSLIENNDTYVLSKAYDLVSTKLVLENDLEDLALSLNGKKTNLKKGDFIKFGKFIGLNDITINKLISNVLNYEEQMISLISESLLNNTLKCKFIELVKNRINILK